MLFFLQLRLFSQFLSLAALRTRSFAIAPSLIRSRATQKAPHWPKRRCLRSILSRDVFLKFNKLISTCGHRTGKQKAPFSRPSLRHEAEQWEIDSRNDHQVTTLIIAAINDMKIEVLKNMIPLFVRVETEHAFNQNSSASIRRNRNNCGWAGVYDQQIETKFI